MNNSFNLLISSKTNVSLIFALIILFLQTVFSQGDICTSATTLTPGTSCTYISGDVFGNTVQDLLGGIRSTCTYVGANNLKQLSKCTTFIIAESQYNSVYEHMDTSK